jgi:hypothetical protein
MADYIDTSKLASYLRQPLDFPAGNLYVDLANGLVTEVVGDLSPVPSTVVSITLEVAARGYRSADGFTSVTTSFDDASKTVRREMSAADAGVFLTDGERDRLLAALAAATTPNTRQLGVGTIRTRPATW